MTSENHRDRTWIVRLATGRRPPVEGRLQVGVDELRFRAGTRGDTPPVKVPRASIVHTELVVDGMAESVVLTLADGERVVIDHGVLPAGDLARTLSENPPRRNP